jgi:hypothetical protein
MIMVVVESNEQESTQPESLISEAKETRLGNLLMDEVEKEEKDRSIEKIKELISDDAPLDFKRYDKTTRKEKTLLMEAASNGDVEVMDILVRAGENVNDQTDDGDTVLMRSLMSAPAFDYLMDQKFQKLDFDLKNKDGDTVLTMAEKDDVWLSDQIERLKKATGVTESKTQETFKGTNEIEGVIHGDESAERFRQWESTNPEIKYLEKIANDLLGAPKELSKPEWLEEIKKELRIIGERDTDMKTEIENKINDIFEFGAKFAQLETPKDKASKLNLEVKYLDDIAEDLSRAPEEISKPEWLEEIKKELGRMEADADADMKEYIESIISKIESAKPT